MLPHQAIDDSAQAGGTYNYQQFFTLVKPFFQAADIRFCNQESPSAATLPISSYPTFNAPPQFPADLSAVGCNLVNLANNHADDKGQTGIDETLEAWSSLHPLAAVGTSASAADQDVIHYFTVKGVTFAYLAYAECSNDKSVTAYGVNLLSDRALVTEQVAEARKTADIVLVGTHSCTEDTYTPDSTITSWDQYFADQGVDAVIGTGPHWLQPVRRLPKPGGGYTIVWYSIGNFLSAQTDIGGLVGGFAVMDVDTQTKKITDIGFLPTYMHYEWTAAQKAANDLLARHDFMIYPLDQAAVAMADSQDDTTVAAQTEQVTSILNTYTDVPILTSKTLFSFR
jgi:poly-gamma-glutamate synthesis protein (capsule biosynthesis protein)